MRLVVVLKMSCNEDHTHGSDFRHGFCRRTLPSWEARPQRPCNWQCSRRSDACFPEHVCLSDVGQRCKHAFIIDSSLDLFQPHRRRGFPERERSRLMTEVDAAVIALRPTDPGTALPVPWFVKRASVARSSLSYIGSCTSRAFWSY